MSRTPSVGSAAAPAAAFARAMTAFGPFEARPVLAVAVSGGADSMALALLADAWARGKGGRIVALTVDHGLRGGSAAEAVQVAAWLAARGIEHRILPWIGAKPASAIQAKARA
ncbi:MAG: tRNA lysidine(34) synthetase TilS, partial [Alphaproteobacteria bacterium]|nr:tRNA lysidine(34) synthetase TilS [Alphaproteobacteria bacterium]